MILTRKSMSRRTLLRGAGATIALPLLDAMIPAMTAQSRTAAVPIRRFGAVYVPHGKILSQWTPATQGTVRVGHGEVSLPVAHKAVSKPAKPAPAAAQKPPADEYDDMVEDDAPAAAVSADPRDAHIAELTRACSELLAENTRIGDVFDADDKLAASMASNAELAEQNKQLTALLKTANERVNGLMFEKQQMTAEVTKLQRQLARLKKSPGADS